MEWCSREAVSSISTANVLSPRQMRSWAPAAMQGWQNGFIGSANASTVRCNGMLHTMHSPSAAPPMRVNTRSTGTSSADAAGT